MGACWPLRQPHRGRRFTLEGKEHQLTLNTARKAPTAATKGSRFQVFDAKQLSPSSVEMSYTFADGEEGYPGTLPLRVVYSVTDDNALAIDYTAVAVDKSTVINLTSRLLQPERQSWPAGPRPRRDHQRRQGPGDRR